MPYKDIVKQRAMQLKYMQQRRAAWFAANGPCILCGSWNDLQLDHKSRLGKISHKVWSWSEERRNSELLKCQALCGPCHKEKTSKENRKEGPAGTAWCSTCQVFKSTALFNVDKYHWNGFMRRCSDCRRSEGWYK